MRDNSDAIAPPLRMPETAGVNNGDIAVYTFCTSNVAGTYEVATNSLKNYYAQYDIPLYTFDETHETIGKAFKMMTEANYRDLAIPPWYAAVTARMCLFSMFLESDHEYFIMQDLDYIVTRPDINIREKIDHDWIASHWAVDFWRFSDLTHNNGGHQYDPTLKFLYAQKYNNTKGIVFSDNSKMRGESYLLHVLCGDLMVLSRSTVEKIIQFFKDRNCDFMDAKSFNDYTKAIIHRTNQMHPPHNDQKMWGIQEEDFLAAYVEDTDHVPVFLNDVPYLKRDFWSIKEGSWMTPVAELIKTLMRDNNYIFLHLGACDKKEFFPKMAHLFKC